MYALESEADYSETDTNADLEEQSKEDREIELKAYMLLKMLAEQKNGPIPVLYVEPLLQPNAVATSADMEKRSGRYYRRYPWKRQNTRYRA